MARSFKVKAENYVSNFFYLSNSLLRFDRVHRVEKNLVTVDVLPHIWHFAIGNIKKEQLKATGLNAEISIEGPVAVFAPPFSPLQWHLQPGVLEFSGFLSTLRLPPDLPKQPVLLKRKTSTLPQNENDIYECLRSSNEQTILQPPGGYSKTAEQTKQLIDENYYKRISIADLAKKLKLSHSFITRNFKATYGLSPIEYRTKLRLFDAQNLLLLKNLKVSTVAYASGFSDQSRFLKQFRQLFRARPSQFKLKQQNQNLDNFL